MSAADWTAVFRPLRAPASRATSEPRAVRIALIAFALLFAALLLVLPLATVFVSAFAKGALAFWDALR
ncbi:MAG TPA: sulfate ABC transporter permease subunit CysW, partial [Myxococcota bacterium]|nr:sulfate ABC transporter permease subunit CysW [Myxococcota bacterium]